MHASIPSRTALRVALRRAAHQLHDAKPLIFDDPLAVRILGAEYAAELARTPDAGRKPFSAAIRAFMVTRARYAEDVLAAAYRDHSARQYLVLGAGLDTFAYRQQMPGLRVFEVDHPATQAWKQELLAAQQISVPASATHVAVDFETQHLREQLLAAGFAVQAPTVTAWLGVVPYLTLEAFRATLRFLGSLAPGSRVVFDYAQPREVLSERERMMLDSMSARVAQVGEPFQLFLTPQALAEKLHRAGLEVCEDLGGQDLTARYLSAREDGLRLSGKGGRINSASVPVRAENVRAVGEFPHVHG